MKYNANNYNIRILMDTPFDVANTVMSIKDFRLKYGYICSNAVTDDELIGWLIDYKSYPQLKQQKNHCVTEWFEAISILQEPPLSFIYEGVYWTKEMDGFYHTWPNPQTRNLFMSGDTTQGPISKEYINTAKIIFNNAKHKQEIIYCTNTINNKL